MTVSPKQGGFQPTGSASRSTVHYFKHRQAVIGTAAGAISDPIRVGRIKKRPFSDAWAAPT
jgi:hypothetical protein